MKREWTSVEIVTILDDDSRVIAYFYSDGKHEVVECTDAFGMTKPLSDWPAMINRAVLGDVKLTVTLV